jgi:maleylacetate reductase
VTTLDAVMPFIYELRATRVVFAPNAFAELPAELHRLSAERAFVVSTPGRLASLPPLQPLLGPRLAATFDGAVEHVPVDVVERALEQCARANADVCVAIGGGSSIGLGKAIARETGLSLLAVPTTYSGSEMTSIWGMTDAGGKKTGRDPRVAPRVVVYDPALTLALPPLVSAASGMNAMAHAVEALYAANASPVALSLAEEAARLLASSLPLIASTPHDGDARANALAGAHLAGRALDLAAMGLHHRLCHILGGSFGLPHARTHAALLPYVVAFNAPAAPTAMRRLANALNVADPVAGIASLARTLGVATPLSALGLRSEDLERAANEAMTTAYPNPRSATRDEVRALLAAALRGAPVASESG